MGTWPSDTRPRLSFSTRNDVVVTSYTPPRESSELSVDHLQTNHPVVVRKSVLFERERTLGYRRHRDGLLSERIQVRATVEFTW